MVVRFLRGARLAVTLALVFGFAETARAQSGPPAPTPTDDRVKELENEVRELRERLKAIEDSVATRPASKEKQGPGDNPADADTPPKGNDPAPPKGNEPQPPRAGAGTVGPGQQQPEQAPAPGGGATGGTRQEPERATAPSPDTGPRGPAQPPRAGAGAVGPGQQQPERAPAPTLEESVRNAQETLRKAVSAGFYGIELHAFMDMGYVFNFNDPRNGRFNVNRLRLNDPDNNSFDLAWAKLAVLRNTTNVNEWDVGFHLELAVGREAANTLSLDPHFLFQSAFNVAQTYVDLQMPTPVGNPLLIRVGRFYGWFGVESLDTPLNPNFSLSYFANFTPFTTTGVGVGMNGPIGFRYMQYVVNGWDVVVDNNNSKTVGGQLSWTHVDSETALTDAVIAFNWIFGPEQPEKDKNNRTQFELDMTVRPTESTTLLGALGYGWEEHGSVKRVGETGQPLPPDTLTAKFGGAMIIARQEFANVRKGLYRFAVAGRLCYWRDQGGSKSGLDQSLFDSTATFEIHFTENGRLRFEWRRDASTRDHFFNGRRGLPTRPDQNTVTFDAAWSF
jgi:hypothetical protein